MYLHRTHTRERARNIDNCYFIYANLGAVIRRRRARSLAVVRTVLLRTRLLHVHTAQPLCYVCLLADPDYAHFLYNPDDVRAFPLKGIRGRIMFDQF